MPPPDEPPQKKARKGPKLQSNLFAFFASNVPTPPKKKNPTNDSLVPSTDAANSTSVTNDATAADVSSSSNAATTGTSVTIPPPMIPTPTPTHRTITWQSLHDYFLLFRRPAPALFGSKPTPRTKVAALDLDGTLVVWTITSGGWPSSLQHYELWNATLPHKLRQLYDDGYRLLLVSNQAAIQKAHQGKKAQLVQNVINWIAQLIDRPVTAILSTQSSKKEGSFHKPCPKLWHVAQQQLGEEWNLEQSFFVGDSADPEDSQGGVDAKFAKNVGELYGQPLKFYTPDQYFGPSDRQRRQIYHQLHQQEQNQECWIPPATTLKARAALLGGYWQGPILLILCGVQGSGKSTFASSLRGWTHLCQDTIHKGTPGKREQVENAARQALQEGQSVVIDRMHLTAEQRNPMVQIGVEASVPVHVVILTPSATVVAQRVRKRTNHPGNVQGPEGVRRAMQSMNQLVLPTYQESGVTIISCASTEMATTELLQLYSKEQPQANIHSSTMRLSENLALPRVILGTMGLGKRIVKQTVLLAASRGIQAVDTAPTYNNETEVGDALKQLDSALCIAKIPKSVIDPQDVRTSLMTTLERLQRTSVDLLLLHWPCDTRTLLELWKEMEACSRDGYCKALGVCNFTATTLAELIPHVTMPPLVNQVERHPMLAQWDLLDFCARHTIHLQAHTPLGQGKEELLRHEVIQAVAREAGMSPAGAVLQWNLQQGISVVPKASSQAHFDDLLSGKPLTSDHMKRLNELDRGRRFVAPPFMFGSTRYSWGNRRPLS